MEKALQHNKLVLCAPGVVLSKLRGIVVEVLKQLKMVYGCCRHRSIEILFAVVCRCFFVEGQVHSSEICL